MTLTVGGAVARVDEILLTMMSVVHSSTWTRELLVALLEDQGDRSVIAAAPNDDSLLGYALAYPLRSFNDCMFPGPTIFLRRLFVRPNARCCGIGQVLLRTVIQESETSITWQTSTDAHDMVGWFARRGHQPVGMISDGHRRDLIYRCEGGSQQ
jgi:GNAT superfamily N-acetyltransferase